MRFVLATGKHTIAFGAEKFDLGPLDCLIFAAEVTDDLVISGDSEVFLIELVSEGEGDLR